MTPRAAISLSLFPSLSLSLSREWAWTGPAPLAHAAPPTANKGIKQSKQASKQAGRQAGKGQVTKESDSAVYLLTDE